MLPKSLKGLGRGAGEENIPRSGKVLTLSLVLGAVMTGNLNVIAPILTIFFLTTYAVLNVAAGVETFLDSPSFRPEFKVHWSLPLLGAAGCIGVMFLINWWATLVAGLSDIVIFLWLERPSLRTTWGDVRQGPHGQPPEARRVQPGPTCVYAPPTVDWMTPIVVGEDEVLSHQPHQPPA